MKFKFIYSLFSLLFFAFLFSSNSGGRAASGGNGATGAPGDQVFGGSIVTCANSSCHSAGSPTTLESNPTLELTDEAGASIAEAGYIPGTTYNAKVTVNVTSGSAAGHGFQILALNAAMGVDGDEVSNWVAESANTKISVAGANGRTYGEHTTTSSSNEFELTWTAPDDLDGDVTFYFCRNAVNGNGGTSGDGAGCSTLTIAKNTATSNNDLSKAALQLKAFPNPTSDMINLDITVERSDTYSMRLVNNLGQVIQSTQWDLNSGENRQTIHLNEFTSGVYSILLTNGSESIRQHVVKL